MSLSIGEAGILRNEYDQLIELVREEQQAIWVTEKENIIKFCIDNDIHLYNIATLAQINASKLLGLLIELFSLPHQLMEEHELVHLEEQKLAWKKEFEESVREADSEFVNLHQQAYLSVGHQYQQTQAVSAKTLLTLKDMQDLLSEPKFISDKVLVSEPFSLTEISSDQEGRVKALIAQDYNDEKVIFLPITHEGHWFYLLKKEGSWSVQDSQPTLIDEVDEEAVFSPRQESMMEQSALLLEKLGVECDELGFETTGIQLNDYDCGTQVTNAYRKIVDENYAEQSHKEMIVELLDKQLPEEILLPENVEEIFVQELPLLDDLSVQELSLIEDFTEQEQLVIEATTSAQASPEKIILYKQSVAELINAVVKQGLFAEVKNKIDLETIDIAEADEHESDEEFATRLQEAEFRKVGLN